MKENIRRSTSEERERLSNPSSVGESLSKGLAPRQVPFKIAETILEIDRGVSQTNRPNDKKADYYAQGDGIDKLNLSRKDEGIRVANTEDCLNSSIQRFEDNIKNSKERLTA